MLLSQTLKLEEFEDDPPWQDESSALSEIFVDNQIEGVKLRRLYSHGDQRGNLTVLMTNLNDSAQWTGHVYQVNAAPGSVRAWVYHKRQSDRLAFTLGNFRIVLYDQRPDSSTHGQVNVLDVGLANKVQLTIPPFVIHGVQNRGAEFSTFMNMPDNTYDPGNPDKSRLPPDHPAIPYQFE